jgi:hypothetical protein
VAVVLFGSRARGDSSAESDWDLLVIADGLPEKPFQRHLFLTRALPPGCEAVSLLARTPEEFDAHVSSLHFDIALDGKILINGQVIPTNLNEGCNRLIISACFDKKGASHLREFFLVSHNATCQ